MYFYSIMVCHRISNIVPMLYSKTLLFIHPIHTVNSLHLEVVLVLFIFKIFGCAMWLVRSYFLTRDQSMFGSSRVAFTL